MGLDLGGEDGELGAAAATRSWCLGEGLALDFGGEDGESGAAAATRSWRLGECFALDFGGEDGESGARAVARVVRRGVTGWDMAANEEARAKWRPAARGSSEP